MTYRAYYLIRHQKWDEFVSFLEGDADYILKHADEVSRNTSSYGYGRNRISDAWLNRFKYNPDSLIPIFCLNDKNSSDEILKRLKKSTPLKKVDWSHFILSMCEKDPEAFAWAISNGWKDVIPMMSSRSHGFNVYDFKSKLEPLLKLDSKAVDEWLHNWGNKNPMLFNYVKEPKLDDYYLMSKKNVPFENGHWEKFLKLAPGAESLFATLVSLGTIKVNDWDAQKVFFQHYKKENQDLSLDVDFSI